jgi:hypothetical protein
MATFTTALSDTAMPTPIDILIDPITLLLRDVPTRR